MKRILVAFAIAIALTTIPIVDRSVAAGLERGQTRTTQRVQTYGAFPTIVASNALNVMSMDDPNFCYEGWTYTSEIQQVGQYCRTYKTVESCASSGISYCSKIMTCADGLTRFLECDTSGYNFWAN